MALTPPVWLQYGTASHPNWFNGTAYGYDDVEIPRQIARTGEQRFHVKESSLKPSLVVYDNEVWRIPWDRETAVGGSLVGARAEVVLQSQALVGNRRFAGATLFVVESPEFDLNFALESAKSQARWLSVLNSAAEFINNRAKQLRPEGAGSSAAPRSVADELSKLAALRADGHLSDAEFTQLKARLLAGS